MFIFVLLFTLVDNSRCLASHLNKTLICLSIILSITNRDIVLNPPYLSGEVDVGVRKLVGTNSPSCHHTTSTPGLEESIRHISVAESPTFGLKGSTDNFTDCGGKLTLRITLDITGCCVASFFALHRYIFPLSDLSILTDISELTNSPLSPFSTVDPSTFLSPANQTRSGRGLPEREVHFIL